MLSLEDLKEYVGSTPWQIRKYIEENKHNTPRTEYVAWLENGEFGEVIYRVWAYKTTKKKGQQFREVMRSILGDEQLIYRDMYLSYMGGYKVVFERSSGESNNWYDYSYYSYGEEDFGRWWKQKTIGVPVHILNLDMLKDTKFKYCGYQGNGDFLEWMRTYIQYPEVEFLGKLGFPPSKKLLKKASKDKAFCKYLAKVNPDNNINAICYAYDHNMTIHDAGLLLLYRQEAGKKFHGNPYLKRAKINICKASEYVEKVGCNPQSYCDYIEACLGLGLDMKDTKNIFPDEFWKMHVLRINQWDAKKNKKKYTEFKKAAANYVKYEFQGDKYSIVIPKKFRDLKVEGSVLNHCVAKMGYENKMIKGETFIAFVRKNDSLKTPFVTVEVSCKSKKILQCYGEYDSNPGKEVNAFVKAWSKEIKKVI